MLFSAVSAPMLSSDPGRSLLIDAGRQTIGMPSAGWSPAPRCSAWAASIAGPSADHQQSVDAVGRNLARQRRRERCRSVRTGSCPARRRHATPSRSHSSSPSLRDHRCASPSKPLLNGQHRVAMVDPDAHCDPNRGVHAGGGPSAVQDGEPQSRAGRARGRMRLRTDHRADHAEGVAEAPASHLHCGVIVLLGDDIGHRACLAAHTP